MAFDLLFFGSLRDAMGRDGERVDPPASVATVADLVDWLAARGGREAAALADRGRLRCAVDQRMAAFDATLGPVREVALFPPVTGG